MPFWDPSDAFGPGAEGLLRHFPDPGPLQTHVSSVAECRSGRSQFEQRSRLCAQLLFITFISDRKVKNPVRACDAIGDDVFEQQVPERGSLKGLVKRAQQNHETLAVLNPEHERNGLTI